MAASLEDKYRLITVEIPNANTEITPIRLAGGDIAGRVLKVTGWDKNYAPRLAYNPNPGGGASGGYITPTSIADGKTFDVDAATDTGYCYFEMPRGIFKNPQAVLAFELLDGDTTVISSRRIPLIVEPPVVNTDGGEAYDGLSDLHNAVSIANDASAKATTAESTFNAAVAQGRKDVQALIDSANITASSEAVAPKTDPTVTATPDSNGVAKDFHFSLPRARKISAATASEVNPSASPTVTVGTNADGDQTLALGIPRAPHFTATATSDNSAAASVTQTADANGDQTLAFTIPRGKSIASVSATATENGGSPTANLTQREDGDWDLALTIPRGEKGDKGNAGDVATTTVAGVVKPGTGLTVTADGTLNAQEVGVATSSKAGVVKPGEGLTVTSDGTLGVEVALDSRLILRNGVLMTLDDCVDIEPNTSTFHPMISDSMFTNSASSFFVSLELWLLAEADMSGATTFTITLKGITPQVAIENITRNSVYGAFDTSTQPTIKVSKSSGGSNTVISLTFQSFTHKAGVFYAGFIVTNPSSVSATALLQAGRSKDEIAEIFTGYTVTWDDQGHATVTRQTDPPETNGPTA